MCSLTGLQHPHVKKINQLFKHLSVANNLTQLYEESASRLWPFPRRTPSWIKQAKRVRRQARLSRAERLHQASGVRSGKSKWLLHTTGNLILRRARMLSSPLTTLADGCHNKRHRVNDGHQTGLISETWKDERSSGRDWRADVFGHFLCCWCVWTLSLLFFFTQTWLYEDFHGEAGATWGLEVIGLKPKQKQKSPELIWNPYHVINQCSPLSSRPNTNDKFAPLWDERSQPQELLCGILRL